MGVVVARFSKVTCGGLLGKTGFWTYYYDGINGRRLPSSLGAYASDSADALCSDSLLPLSDFTSNFGESLLA